MQGPPRPEPPRPIGPNPNMMGADQMEPINPRMMGPNAPVRGPMGGPIMGQGQLGLRGPGIRPNGPVRGAVRGPLGNIMMDPGPVMRPMMGPGQMRARSSRMMLRNGPFRGPLGHVMGPGPDMRPMMGRMRPLVGRRRPTMSRMHPMMANTPPSDQPPQVEEPEQ